MPEKLVGPLYCVLQRVVEVASGIRSAGPGTIQLADQGRNRRNCPKPQTLNSIPLHTFQACCLARCLYCVPALYMSFSCIAL